MCGAFEMTADGHLVDALVVFVDHMIDEYLSLPLSNDPSRIYNIVTIAYGDGQEYTVKDEASIDAYGRRELSLTLLIGPEQTACAKPIAQDYLADYKDPKTVVSLSIKTDYDYGSIHKGSLNKQKKVVYFFSLTPYPRRHVNFCVWREPLGTVHRQLDVHL